MGLPEYKISYFGCFSLQDANFCGGTQGEHFTDNYVINGVGVKTVTALVGTLKAILCSLHNNANRHALPLRREVSYFLTK